MTDGNWKLVARIADTAQKLYDETARLRRDVLSLESRIVPFDEAPEIKEPILESFQHRNLKEALDTIAAAREGIRAAEYDLSAIRATIDNIASDTFLRAEMEPFILDSRSRPRKKPGE